MSRLRTLITFSFKRFLQRYGPTLDELEELQEIEEIANRVFDSFKHTA